MSTVKFKGSTSGEAEVTVAAAAGTPTITLPTASINLATDGSNGQYLKTDGAGTLSFATVASPGGATGTDYNDSVKVRLGTDNDLEIYHTGSQGHIKNTTGTLRLCSDTIFLRGEGDSEDYIKCWKDGAVKLYYDDSDKLETTAAGVKVIGNLIIGTGGDGIDFSDQTATSATGASMSAELLDHYEEGSWTPVMKFGGGTTGMSATQNGTYTRIGRVVFFTAHITLSDKGSSSGTVTVDGLPFNVWGSQLTGTSLQAGIHIWFQEDMADIPNDQGSATGYIASGPTITFRYFDSNNNSGSNLTDSHLADTSSWRFSGQYFVA